MRTSSQRVIRMNRKAVLALVLVSVAAGAWGLILATGSPHPLVAVAAAALPEGEGEVVVYGRETCGYTRRMLAFLQDERVPVRYFDVDDPAVEAAYQAKFHGTALAEDGRYRLPIVEHRGIASERPEPADVLAAFRRMP